MYIVLRIHDNGENSSGTVWEMVVPSVLKRKRQIVGLARKITIRLLPRSVLRVDIYTRQQIQDTKGRICSVTEAVGQLEKSGRAFVFKNLP